MVWWPGRPGGPRTRLGLTAQLFPVHLGWTARFHARTMAVLTFVADERGGLYGAQIRDGVATAVGAAAPQIALWR